MRLFLLIPVLAASIAWGSTGHAQSVTEVRAQLQAALQRNLSREMIGGALYHLDLETGDITQYYPTETHAVIVKLGEASVMCSTLISEDGTEIEVDYYIAGNDHRFGVIRTEIDNRAPLEALMEAGKAVRLE